MSNRMQLYYVLDGHNVKEADRDTWSTMFDQDRHVARDYVGEIFISTVFLGIDHNFEDGGPPLLFETMVFNGPDDMESLTRRYSTWDEAELGHAEVIAQVKAMVE